MRISSSLGLSLCVAFASLTANGQQAMPDGNVRTYIQGIDIPPIANAPFAARVVVTWAEPLVGGGTNNRKYYTMVARDSQGRVHRETRSFVPYDSNQDSPLRTISILDPIAGTRIECTQSTMSCSTAAYHARLALGGDAGGTLPAGSGNIKRENLGDQTIDSLHAVGTRETATSQEGDHGSDRLIISHREIWYSPDLQIDLSVVRTSPQLGQVALTVTDLDRREPDASWFTVPTGFEVLNANNH
jgi:hypothetical protein